MPKGTAPDNTYWRGDTLWGRIMVAGREIRWSLRTGDGPTATRRVEERRKVEEAAAHYGEHRKSYDQAFAAWSIHVADQIAPSTAQRYAVSLQQLAPFLRPRFVDEIDRALVSEIVNARRAQKVTTATIRRDLTALSSVLDYADGEEWREGNPALDRLRKLKERRDPIVLPEPADIARVVGIAPGNLAALTRAALLTGCRQDELVTAERRRLDRATRQLTVVGKGNKLRVVQLSPAAFAVLAAIPVSLRSPWLFWHGPGEPYRNVSSRFAALVESARISAQKAKVEFRPFNFHHLRHRYAVDYLKTREGRIYDLLGQLGHTSVKTTEVYLKYLTPEEARAAKFG